MGSWVPNKLTFGLFETRPKNHHRRRSASKDGWLSRIRQIHEHLTVSTYVERLEWKFFLRMFYTRRKVVIPVRDYEFKVHHPLMTKEKFSV